MAVGQSIPVRLINPSNRYEESQIGLLYQSLGYEHCQHNECQHETAGGKILCGRYHYDRNARRKCLTERYFVSCTAPAEISVLVSVSAVGNNILCSREIVDVADHNIIRPHYSCLAG